MDGFMAVWLDATGSSVLTMTDRMDMGVGGFGVNCSCSYRSKGGA